MEITKISCFRGKVQWVQRGLYYYTASRYRGGSIYYRCGSTGCPARWVKKGGHLGAVKKQHDHDPEPWIPDRNQMFCRIKQRCIFEPEVTSFKTIYDEEALWCKNAAIHLPYKTILPSMRSWRRSRKQQPVVATTFNHEERENNIAGNNKFPIEKTIL